MDFRRRSLANANVAPTDQTPHSDCTMQAIRFAVRAALQLAIQEKARVVAVLRPDPSAGMSRAVEGVPYEIATKADGRERVHLHVAEGTEQVLLVERIMRVIPARPT